MFKTLMFLLHNPDSTAYVTDGPPWTSLPHQLLTYKQFELLPKAFRQKEKWLPLACGESLRFASGVHWFTLFKGWQTWAIPVGLSGQLLSRNAVRTYKQAAQQLQYWLLAALTATFICGTHKVLAWQCKLNAKSDCKLVWPQELRELHCPHR